MSSIGMCELAGFTVLRSAIALCVMLTGPPHAVAQETAATSNPGIGLAKAGSFVLDETYPKSGEPAHIVNFSLIRQTLKLPQDVNYFIFEPQPDVFSLAEGNGSPVLGTLAICDAVKDRPAWGYQGLGASLERFEDHPALRNYVDQAVRPGAVFVPVLKNLRLYEPPGKRIAYEWLERAATEGQLCFRYKAVGLHFGSRASPEIRLSDYATFEYR